MMKSFEEMLKESNRCTDQNPVDPNYHSEEADNSVSKRWFFDVQWSDCPDFVEKEVRSLWRNFELGNDNYIFNFDMSCEDQRLDYPYIYGWLKYNGVSDDEKVVVHWWW